MERDYASRPYPQPNPEPPKPENLPPADSNMPKIPAPSLGEHLRVLPSSPQLSQVPSVGEHLRVLPSSSHIGAPISAPVLNSHHPSPSVGEGVRRPSHTLAPLSTKRKRVEDKDISPAQQEALAQTLYTRINGLSLKNARKLARTYSEKNINLALQRLQQRTNLANPTGFFVTVLRSTARMEEKV